MEKGLGDEGNQLAEVECTRSIAKRIFPSSGGDTGLHYREIITVPNVGRCPMLQSEK